LSLDEEMTMSTQDPIRDVAVASEPRPEGTEPASAPRRSGRTLLIGAVIFGGVALAAVLMFVSPAETTSAPAGAAPPQAPAAEPPPVQTALSPLPLHLEGSPHDRAGALRRDATQACKAALWDRCKNDVEEAAKLDPEGDKIPVVQRLHRAGEQGHF
jgi:hypothetical protein